MPHHDPLCPQKNQGWHIVLDGGCGYCEVIRKAKAEEQERITRDIVMAQQMMEAKAGDFPSNFYAGIMGGIEIALKKVSPHA